MERSLSAVADSMVDCTMRNDRQRRQGTPILVQKRSDVGPQAVRLARRPFQREDIDEGWLQTLIHQHPNLLAVEEIEPDYAPLIPIGREVATDAGPIDNLYINPNGLITLVEAKLWKNPEARREVVGQILDYAHHLTRWTYDDLDARTRFATDHGLWDHVRRHAPGSLDIDEDEFVDAVTRNLSRGRFLLLIVGDGIKESTEQLATYLQGTPNLRFTLALVEMRVYDVPGSNDLLVVPSVVARTQEIVHAVVDLRDSTRAIDVTAPEVLTPETSPTYSRRAIRDEDFFEAIERELGPSGVRAAKAFLDAAAERNLIIDARSASRMVKIKDPNGSGKHFTLFGIHKSGTLTIGWLAGQTVEAGVAFEGSPAQRYLREITSAFGTFLTADKGSVAPEFWRKKPRITEAKAKLPKFLDALDTYLDAIRTP
jgi:hypothetical protein